MPKPPAYTKQVDYDWIFGQVTTTLPYLITGQQQATLLAFGEMIHSPTRWNKNPPTPAQIDAIDALVSDLEYRLIWPFIALMDDSPSLLFDDSGNLLEA